MIISAHRLFTGTELTGPGWVRTAGDQIVQVGQGSAPEAPDLALEEDEILAPGFVDAHSHGGGGASFSTTSDADIDTVLALHASHGTTTMMASLVTGTIDELCEQVRVLSRRVHAGDLIGIHLEGPWLSPDRKGAHDEGLLLAPRPDDISRILLAGEGTVGMVTLAPELEGAQEAIAHFLSAGTLVAVGHTSCDYDTARHAIKLGATGATHLLNAMPGLGHREPGPVLALLRDRRVFLEFILDGVHVHPDLVSMWVSQYPERAVLITDAMAATGQPDGDYVLGALPVSVVDGVARIAGTDTIAGSTLTLDRAVALAVASGVDRAVALRAATSNPARYVGCADRGFLEADCRADLVVLDDAMAVRHVMLRGEWFSA